MSKRATVGALLLTVLVLSFVSGCGESGPAVATDVPPVQIAPAPDLAKGRPKGMPKNITAGIKLDPVSGRPKQD